MELIDSRCDACKLKTYQCTDCQGADRRRKQEIKKAAKAPKVFEAVSIFDGDKSRDQLISGADAQMFKGSGIPGNARKLHHAASIHANVSSQA